MGPLGILYRSSRGAVPLMDGGQVFNNELGIGLHGSIQMVVALVSHSLWCLFSFMFRGEMIPPRYGDYDNSRI